MKSRVFGELPSPSTQRVEFTENPVFKELGWGAMLHGGGGPSAMTDEVLSFYEVLAEYYHLIFEDWDRSIQRQAGILSSVISQQLPGHLTILDCACGIGTQSIGLATLGHRLPGSDLSPAEVARATREARKRGLDVEFRISDIVKLAEIPETGFDVVSVFDNALPHLTPEDLIRAAGAMATKLKPGGLLIASIRDYDLILEEKPAMQPPSFFGNTKSRRIVQQVWDWTENEAYMLHLYISVEADQGWRTHHFTSKYRAVTRKELSNALRSVGFREPIWLMPEESGYYQPLVLARHP